MSIRKITVISVSKTRPTVLHTAATTWGQLKDSLINEFPDLEKYRVTVRETKNDLASPEAVLPEGDTVIYLTAKQIKAGGVNVVALLEGLKEKWNEAIDELIEEAEDGNFDVTEVTQRASVGAGIPASYAEDLRKLQREG